MCLVLTFSLHCVIIKYELKLHITLRADSKIGITRANSASVSNLITEAASALTLAAASSTKTTALTLLASVVSLSIT